MNNWGKNKMRKKMINMAVRKILLLLPMMVDDTGHWYKH
jgi:hypothetical protein